MTVFKTFIKVLKAYKVTILMYTVLLIVFSSMNMTTGNNSAQFMSSQPNILIINKDEEVGITQSMIDYLSKHAVIKSIKNDEDAINDALFYRDVNYIIYIPPQYRINFLKGENPKIEIKSTGDYQSSLADLILERYINVANMFNQIYDDEAILINKVEETLAKETTVEITSKLDTNQLSNAAYYYNFMNYSLLAGCVYVICLVLSSFKEESVRKRTIISSINYKKYNRQLLWSNGLFAFVLWGIYVLLSFVLVGNIMWSLQGLIYIINSFIFGLCALTIGFLIANLVNDKGPISSIVNIVALGSSFLCGAFVPMQWLPDSVLKIAHILPSYWYIKSNELLKSIEVLNKKTLEPVLMNMLIMVCFSILFIILTNVIAKKKQKLD